MDNKNEWKLRIESNIQNHGYHITVVQSGLHPRFAYTIGLSKLLGFELVFAGGVYFSYDDLIEIFQNVVKKLKLDIQAIKNELLTDKFSHVSFSEVEESWSRLLMLWVYEYFKIEKFQAFQIIPDAKYATLDIPDLSSPFDAAANPVWQWLVKEWDLDAPKESTVVTNLDALFGHPITEVTRWESDNWEMFAGAGPDVEEEDTRIVSLGIILGIDKTLLPALQLEIGGGIWRESLDDSWHDWE